MAKLVYVPREKIEKGRRKLERLLAKDEFWQEEHKRIKKFEAEEKTRRDAEYVARLESEQAQMEVPK